MKESKVAPTSSLDLDTAVRGGLEPEPMRAHRATAVPAAGAGVDEVRRAGDEDVVVPGDPAPDLPPDPAIDPDLQDEVPSCNILAQRVGEERREGDAGARQDRRPDVDVAVALVHLRQPGRQRDLLVLVGRRDVEAVVVDADAAVRVAGGERHLRRRGEQRRRAVGQVELPERGVLQVEARVGGAEDQVDDERDHAGEEREGEEDEEQAAAGLAEVVVRVVAAVLAHGWLVVSSELAGVCALVEELGMVSWGCVVCGRLGVGFILLINRRIRDW